MALLVYEEIRLSKLVNYFYSNIYGFQFFRHFGIRRSNSNFVGKLTIVTQIPWRALPRFSDVSYNNKRKQNMLFNYIPGFYAANKLLRFCKNNKIRIFAILAMLRQIRTQWKHHKITTNLF